MLLVTGPDRQRQDHDAVRGDLRDSDRAATRSSRSRTRSNTSCQGVLQIPVNEKKGLTFARGLRSILRHDPDKIMVGEIRDPETAQIAIQSALTGHLVFTTVHANNVFDVIGRFVHMGVDTYSFVSALSAAFWRSAWCASSASSARRPTRRTRELLEESQAQVLQRTPPSNSASGAAAGTAAAPATDGRKAVGELLVLNDEIREAIIARAPVRQLKELAQRAGVRLIRQSALELVRRGRNHARRGESCHHLWRDEIGMYLSPHRLCAGAHAPRRCGRGRLRARAAPSSGVSERRLGRGARGVRAAHSAGGWSGAAHARRDRRPLGTLLRWCRGRQPEFGRASASRTRASS